MKKAIILVLFLISISSFALANDLNQGVYVGAQAGYANLHYDQGWLQNTEGFDWAGSVESSGFAGRVYFGYQFNAYFSAEMGYVALPEVKFNDIGVAGFSNTVNESFKQSIADVLLKVITPLKNNFDVFVKAGYANVFRDDLKITVDGGSVNANLDDHENVAVAGVGSSYHFTRNASVDVSYLHYFGRHTLEPTDFGGMGVSYLFG